MKKYLAAFGSLVLITSSTTSVIACERNQEKIVEDDSKYDDSPQVKELTEDALSRLKSIVLADQFGLSDKVNWTKITSYNPRDSFTTNFNANSVETATKINLNLKGHKGEFNILLKEIIEAVVVEIKKIPVIGGPVGDAIDQLDINKYLDGFGEAITVLPKLIADMAPSEIISLIPMVIQLISVPLANAIPIGEDLLVPISNAAATGINSALTQFGIYALIDELIKAVDVETYKDASFQELSVELWMSLFTTIAYGMNANYFTNPETEISMANADHVFDKINKVVISKTTIEPVDGEVTEQFGVVKYAFKTIKILEIFLHFFGEEFFTFQPNPETWTARDGNNHLFSEATTNADYFKNLNPQKVSTLTTLENGLNLKFYWKVLKTFLANDEDQEHGMMFQKLLNAIATNYDDNGNFQFILWERMFQKLITDAGGIAIRPILRYITPLFPGLFLNVTNTVSGGVAPIIRLLRNLLERLIGKEATDMLVEIANFLSSDKGREFLNKEYDFFWSNDISLMLPATLNPIKEKLKVAQLNASSFLYEVNIIDLFETFNVDLTKYGDAYTNNSLAEFISKFDKFTTIDTVAYSDLDKDNFDLEKIKVLMGYLFKNNAIHLTDEEDAEKNVGEDEKNHSFIRQLISNLKGQEIIQKTLGFVIKTEDDQSTVEVVKASIVGLILEFIYPTITSSGDNFTFEDFEKIAGFNGDFLRGTGNLLTALLEGKDYTYLIRPLVTNDDVWKVSKTTNIYFENSNGQLMYQQLEVKFDATGVKLDDGTVLDNRYQGTYTLTFRRTRILDQFNFTNFSKRFKR